MTSYETSAESNICGAFSLLLSLDVKICVYFPDIHTCLCFNTLCKSSPYLSNRFTIDHHWDTKIYLTRETVCLKCEDQSWWEIINTSICRSSWKVQYLCPILSNIRMCLQILVKIPNMKLDKNPSGESRPDICRWVDRHDWANRHFSLDTHTYK